MADLYHLHFKRNKILKIHSQSLDHEDLHNNLVVLCIMVYILLHNGVFKNEYTYNIKFF